MFKPVDGEPRVRMWKRARPETIFFLLAALLLSLVSIAAAASHTRLHLHNQRVAYGMNHVVFALACVAGFSAALALLQHRLRVLLDRSAPSLALCFVVIAVLYGIFWFPVVIAGGFVQDDWQLLAGAATRTIVLQHPTLAWNTLDTVDGNFRPLGTVIYFGYMYRFFGNAPVAFLSGNLLVSLASCVVASLLVVELGYSRIAGVAAAILYLSRGMVYTQIAWASALGDGLAVLFCGLAVLLVMRAMKLQGLSSILCHVAAWLCFVTAALSKQSAFALPCILAALMYLRPGDGGSRIRMHRVLDGALVLLVYGSTASVIFFHARTLLAGHTPYPLTLNVAGLASPLSYVAWYFLAVDFARGSGLAKAMPGVVGFIIIIALFFVTARRLPRLLGDRPQSVIFSLTACVASLALLVPLGSRITPYYGTMFAFWMSIALALMLANAGHGSKPASTRLYPFIVCVLVLVGYLDVRLKQTGLLPSGGYIWGTFGMDTERALFQQISRSLAGVPAHSTVVLVDCPSYPAYYASMVLLAEPSASRVVAYTRQTGAFLGNNHQGIRPENTNPDLQDAAAYNWRTPARLEDAGAIWLSLDGGRAQRIEPPLLAPQP